MTYEEYIKSTGAKPSSLSQAIKQLANTKEAIPTTPAVIPTTYPGVRNPYAVKNLSTPKPTTAPQAPNVFGTTTPRQEVKDTGVVLPSDTTDIAKTKVTPDIRAIQSIGQQDITPTSIPTNVDRAIKSVTAQSTKPTIGLVGDYVTPSGRYANEDEYKTVARSATIANTVLPFKAMIRATGAESYKENQKLAQEFKKSNPVDAAITEGVGSLFNWYAGGKILSSTGIPGSITTKTDTLLEGLRNWPILGWAARAIPRVADVGILGGAIAGAETALDTTEFTPKSIANIGVQTAKGGLEAGLTFGLGGSFKSKLANVLGVGSTSATLGTIETLIKNKTLTTEDILNIAGNALVLAAFEAMGGRGKEEGFKLKEKLDFQKDLNVARIMSNNPEISRESAKKVLDIVENSARTNYNTFVDRTTKEILKNNPKLTLGEARKQAQLKIENDAAFKELLSQIQKEEAINVEPKYAVEQRVERPVERLSAPERRASLQAPETIPVSRQLPEGRGTAAFSPTTSQNVGFQIQDPVVRVALQDANKKIQNLQTQIQTLVASGKVSTQRDTLAKLQEDLRVQTARAQDLISRANSISGPVVTPEQQGIGRVAEQPTIPDVTTEVTQPTTALPAEPIRETTIQPVVRTTTPKTSSLSQAIKTVAKGIKKETPEQIKTRLEKEKQTVAEGAPITETIVPITETSVGPYRSDMTDYEKGLYAAEQERKKLITPKAGGMTKEKMINDIYKKYSKLQDLDDPTDEDFIKIEKLADEYQNLTGQDIALHEITIVKTPMNDASLLRVYDTSTVSNKDIEKMWYSKAMPARFNISRSSSRLIPDEAKLILENIENGRLKWNVAEESLKIVRKYKAVLSQNKGRTEGYNIGNIVGYDSLNNVLLVAHELTHKLLADGSYVLTLAHDPEIKKELEDVYDKYYPGTPKDKATATEFIKWNEGAAEFIRQHLYNPSVISIEYPNLSTKFLNNGPLAKKDISEMYNDVNKILYIYQNLSDFKKEASLIASNIELKKQEVTSVLVGRTGRIIANSQDSLYPMHVVDENATHRIYKKNASFLIDSRGRSTELMASMTGPVANVALNNLEKTKQNGEMLDETGNIVQFRDFGLGAFLNEIEKNGDYEDYGTYLVALDAQREAGKLKDLQQNLTKYQVLLLTERIQKKQAILKNKIRKTEKAIKNIQEILNARPGDLETQKRIIEVGKTRFAKYDAKYSEFWKGHLNLRVKSGVISKDHYNDLVSRPGYSPVHRIIFSDIEQFTGDTVTRSTLPSELMKRKASAKTIINPLSVMAKYEVASLIRYNSQMFYNTLYENGLDNGIIQQGGQGTSHAPGAYIYAKNGNLTKYYITDKIIEQAIEETFGKMKRKGRVDWLLHGSARTFQKFTTQWNIYFAFFKNIFLDIPTSYVMSKTGYIPVVSQLKRKTTEALSPVEKARNQEYINEYKQIGGGIASMYEISYDRKNPYDVIEKITKDKEGLALVGKTLAGWADKTLSATEQFTRREEYIRARNNGDSVAEAYEKSRNVSGSFHKSGIQAKKITRFVPFFNAGIQLSKQFVEATTNKESATRVGIATIISSILKLAGILPLIYAIDNANTQEERDIAFDNAYRYLDKSMYEKTSYFTLNTKYKLAANPILSAPGGMMGLLMLQQRIPEYKINYGQFAYQTLAGIIPNQVTPEIDSTDSFLESVAGRVAGSLPLLNATLALGGVKTYPGVGPLETPSQLKDAPYTRYKEDTNNLAILLGQYTNISPVRIEAMFKALSGTGGQYASDAIGAGILSKAQIDELGIIKKDLATLGFISPTKSAITQSQRTLRSETSNKIYNKEAELTKTKNNLETKNKQYITKYGEDYGVTGPDDVRKDYEQMAANYTIIDSQLKEVNAVKNALSLLSKYEVRGKEIPVNFKNALNKYILAIDSGKLDKVTDTERAMILGASNAYQDVGKTDWSKVPSSK